MTCSASANPTTPHWTRTAATPCATRCCRASMEKRNDDHVEVRQGQGHEEGGEEEGRARAAGIGRTEVHGRQRLGASHHAHARGNGGLDRKSAVKGKRV